MLGAPAFDRECESWFLASAEALLESLADPANEDLAAAAARAQAEIHDFIGGLIDAERQKPHHGFLTELCTVQLGERPLDDTEILNFCTLLCVAGVETTQRLIANVLYALMTHPADLARLRADPDLLGPAIEETLRWLPPNQFRRQYVAAPVTVGDRSLVPGDVVYAMIASANRDAVVFDRPESFELLRFGKQARAGRHLSFGSGPHYCLGTHLANIETHIAITALLTRLPELRLAPSEVKFRGFRNRSPERLELTWNGEA